MTTDLKCNKENRPFCVITRFCSLLRCLGQKGCPGWPGGMPPPLLPHRIIGCSLNSLTSIEGFSYFLFVVIVFILIIQYDFRFLFSSLKKIRGLQRHTLKERTDPVIGVPKTRIRKQ